MKGPVRYSNVSQTQLSVARYYGLMKINGEMYIYNPVDDSLTREDVVKAEKKTLKSKNNKLPFKEQAKDL